MRNFRANLKVIIFRSISKFQISTLFVNSLNGDIFPIFPNEMDSLKDNVDSFEENNDSKTEHIQVILVEPGWFSPKKTENEQENDCVDSQNYSSYDWVCKCSQNHLHWGISWDKKDHIEEINSAIILPE